MPATFTMWSMWSIRALSGGRGIFAANSFHGLFLVVGPRLALGLRLFLGSLLRSLALRLLRLPCLAPVLRNKRREEVRLHHAAVHGQRAQHLVRHVPGTLVSARAEECDAITGARVRISVR